jgi:hypothetical protein
VTCFLLPRFAQPVCRQSRSGDVPSHKARWEARQRFASQAIVRRYRATRNAAVVCQLPTLSVVIWRMRMREREREKLLRFSRPVEVRYVGMGRASFSGLSRPYGFSITRQATNMMVIASFKCASNCVGFCQTNHRVESLTDRVPPRAGLSVQRSISRPAPTLPSSTTPGIDTRACLKRPHADAGLPGLCSW